jgi:SulP family sulfate permease
LPAFSIPNVPFNLETLWIVLPFSLTLAGIGLIESLLTLTLIDEITDTKGKPNKECVGQGLSNLTCGFFGLQTTADGSKREREGRDEERKRY